MCPHGPSQNFGPFLVGTYGPSKNFGPPVAYIHGPSQNVGPHVMDCTKFCDPGGAILYIWVTFFCIDISLLLVTSKMALNLIHSAALCETLHCNSLS